MGACYELQGACYELRGSVFEFGSAVTSQSLIAICCYNSVKNKTLPLYVN
jgi:hypothetical protein